MKEEKPKSGRSGKAFALVAAVAVIAFLLGRGMGLGIGAGSGSGGGIPAAGSVAEESSGQEEPAPGEEEPAAEEEADDAADTSGDSRSEAEETPQTVILSISVVENEYFCDNERIALDDLIARIRATEGTPVVEISDDNASLDAYNELTGRLERERIRYYEK